MKPPQLKFCGFTRQEDVAQAVELRVDAIGLNFYPKSKRYVAPSTARTISKIAEGISMRVGIFVDPTIEQIDQVLDECPLDAIQLHGNETIDWLLEYESAPEWPGLPILKALPYRGPIDDVIWSTWAQECSLGYSPVIGLLVDAYDPVEKGGTGKRANWDLLRPRPGSFLAADGKSAPLILAGGLDAENVIQALQIVEPIGVDLASGIEVSPGVKDPIKMRRMSERVREYYLSR
ncbi:MAG: N-(5-phosphoribosyl)anthranilate isomerase [Planctomycetota bacterium]